MLEGNLAVLRVPHIKEKCPLSRGRLLQARALKSQEKKSMVGISLFFLGIHLCSLSGDHPYKA